MYSPLLSFFLNTYKEPDFDKDLDTNAIKPELKANGPENKFYTTRPR